MGPVQERGQQNAQHDSVSTIHHPPHTMLPSMESRNSTIKRWQHAIGLVMTSNKISRPSPRFRYHNAPFVPSVISQETNGRDHVDAQRFTGIYSMPFRI
jgi:hypothetical protein